MRRAVPIVLALEIALVAALYLHRSCHCGSLGFPLDDSWIHAHFARNVAHGKGMVYSPGQHVASTAVLYSLILAALYWIRPTPICNAMALGLVLHLVAAILIFATARRLRMGNAAALGAATAFAAIPRLMWGALSGMEVPLYVMLTCLGLYWHIRHRADWGLRAYLSCAAFALATLARPECGAFFACSLIDRLLSSTCGAKRAALRTVLASLMLQIVVFSAIIAPAVWYNVSSYGKPLPPAFYAKTHITPSNQRVEDVLSSARLFLCEAADSARRDSWILMLLLVPGFFALLSGRLESGAAPILPLSLLGVPLATALAAPVGRHPGAAQLIAQHGRYSAYLCPLVVLIAATGVDYVGSVLRVRGYGCVWIGRIGAGLFAGSLAVSMGMANWHMAERYALEVSNINNMQVQLGRWCRRLPSDTLIAANDAGAIPYFSRRRILDTVGVVNPEVVPYLRRHRDRQIGLLRYMRERRPDYVIIFPNWYPELSQRRDVLDPVKSIRLRHNVVCGGPEMVVYRAKWR